MARMPAPKTSPASSSRAGVAAMIVLLCVLRKAAPEQAHRAGKVCASVLAAAASFFKTQRKH